MTYAADRKQLQSLTYAFSGSTLFGQTYTYDSSGSNDDMVTQNSDAVDSGRNMTYVYDALNRITSAVSQGSANYPQWGLSWTYDRYGNRLSQNVTAGTAPASSVAVTASTNRITTSGYAYDANGNMTNDAVNTIVYDAENRALSATDGSGTGSYYYNGLGLRVERSFGGTNTVYVFSQGNVIAEYANGTLTEEYTHDGNMLLADYASGVLTYHGFDRLSDRINMNASGAKIGEQGHYPFGESWYATNSTTKWHFTNYERDSESSNDYAKARYDVNRLGRFLTVDSARPSRPDPQLLNRYSYVASDPINRIDPTGRYACVNPPGFNIGCVCSDPEGGFGECVPGGGDGGRCGDDGGDCGGEPAQPQPPPKKKSRCDQPVLNAPPLNANCSGRKNGNIAKAILQSATGGTVDPGIKIDFSNSYTSSGWLTLDGRPYGDQTTASPNAVFQNFHVSSTKYIRFGDITWSIAVTCYGQEVEARATGVTSVTCVH